MRNAGSRSRGRSPSTLELFRVLSSSRSLECQSADHLSAKSRKEEDVEHHRVQVGLLVYILVALAGETVSRRIETTNGGGRRRRKERMSKRLRGHKQLTSDGPSLPEGARRFFSPHLAQAPCGQTPRGFQS